MYRVKGSVSLGREKTRRSSERKFISNRDRMLLLQSQTPMEFGWFVDFLQKNGNITNTLISQLPNEQQAFLQDVYPSILDSTTAEWEGRSDYHDNELDGTGWVNCSLCNQPNRYTYYIVNRVNGQELNVGSDCIKQFGKLKGLEALRSHQKNIIRVRFLNKANKRFPGIEDTVRRWNDELDAFDIIIPIWLEAPYKQLGDRARKLLEKYLTGRHNADLDEFDAILADRERMLQGMQEHVNRNKAKKYAATRTIVRWAQREGRLSLLSTLKRDGEIRPESLPQITNPDFIEQVIRDFNPLMPHGLRIVGHEYADLVILMDGKLKIACRFSDFALVFGTLLFGQNDVTLSRANIMRYARAYDDATVNAILKRLAARLRGTDVTLYGHDVEYDQLIVTDLSRKSYMVFPLRKTTENLMGRVLGSNDADIRDFTALVKRTHSGIYPLSEMANNDPRLKELKQDY